MAKLKIGVFGAYRGMNMIRVLAAHPDAELTAVCDKYEPALDGVKKLAEEYDIQVALYKDFEEFDRHDMDAVVLANYANEHAPYAVRLLREGRHVLSEVQPCETMAQAVELIEAAEESGKVYAYAENYCYMVNTFEMWRRYERGDIGELQYAEGEYLHDCSADWPMLTYGDPKHWRNRSYSTFYCSHSIGPILTSTGLRPVQVVGFESNRNLEYSPLSMFSKAGAGMEIVTLENGAVLKSLHGGLKREPSISSYQLYGKKGLMETPRTEEAGTLNVYIQGERYCRGTHEKYIPEFRIQAEMAKKFGSHGGSDFFPTHFFIEKILGREDGLKYSIDVYRAVEMGICGILAYRSILNGNIPIAVPNLRNKAERDAYRNDRACTNPAVAGDQLLPICSGEVPHIPDEEYRRMAELWRQRKQA